MFQAERNINLKNLLFGSWFLVQSNTFEWISTFSLKSHALGANV